MKFFLSFLDEFVDILSDLLDCWFFVPFLLILLEEQPGSC